MATKHLTAAEKNKLWRANAARKRIVRVDGVKTCRLCGKEKPIADYSVHRQMIEGRTHECRACTNARGRAWRKRAMKRPEFVTARKLSQTKNKARVYKTTLGHIAELEARNKGPCDICGRPPLGRGKQISQNPDNVLHIDHCHKTHKIRGMLCADCNRGLGIFTDNPEWLRRAADYLCRS